jgi:DNA (cytosine-5)-methyltransferase 1
MARGKYKRSYNWGRNQSKHNRSLRKKFTFIDLFCGIGGFHYAAKLLGGKCVFASDIDPKAQDTYLFNHKLKPYGDITSSEIQQKIPPYFDILCAGFPCQPFSNMGHELGFKDPRGTLFFEIVKILDKHKPKGFLLENVRRLASHDNGATLITIVHELEKIGYTVHHRVFSATDFGLPQMRKRIMIVGTLRKIKEFPWPAIGKKIIPLVDLLETNPDKKYTVKDAVQQHRQDHYIGERYPSPSIYSHRISGDVRGSDICYTLRALAPANYLLVDGKRRLTPREMSRIQGFPDTFIPHKVDSVAWKQAGNSVPVPMITAVLKELIDAM